MKRTHEQCGPIVLRPKSAVILPLIVWITAAALFADAVLRIGWAGLRVLPLLALPCALVWMALWRPRLVVDEDHVVVRNVLATHHIGFGAIRAVRIGAMLRLDVETPERGRATITAWNAPGIGRQGFLSRGTERLILQRGGERPLTAGQRLAADQAASPSAVLRERWERYSDAQERAGGPARGGADGSEVADPVATSWTTCPNALELLITAATAALLAVKLAF